MILKNINLNSIGRFCLYIRNKTAKDTTWEMTTSSTKVNRYHIKVPSYGLTFTAEVLSNGGKVTFPSDIMYFDRAKCRLLENIIRGFDSKEPASAVSKSEDSGHIDGEE